MRFIPDTSAPGINNIPLGLGTSIFHFMSPLKSMDEITFLLIAET
jgi:hypothetical protein